MSGPTNASLLFPVRDNASARLNSTVLSNAVVTGDAAGATDVGIGMDFLPSIPERSKLKICSIGTEAAMSLVCQDVDEYRGQSNINNGPLPICTILRANFESMVPLFTSRIHNSNQAIETVATAADVDMSRKRFDMTGN